MLREAAADFRPLVDSRPGHWPSPAALPAKSHAKGAATVGMMTAVLAAGGPVERGRPEEGEGIASGVMEKDPPMRRRVHAGPKAPHQNLQNGSGDPRRHVRRQPLLCFSPLLLPLDRQPRPPGWLTTISASSTPARARLPPAPYPMLCHVSGCKHGAGCGVQRRPVKAVQGAPAGKRRLALARRGVWSADQGHKLGRAADQRCWSAWSGS
jgi:hypothetical protein